MSPLASANPAAEQVNTAHNEKTFRAAALEVSHRCFHMEKERFPETGLVYLGKLIPLTVFLHIKIKTTRWMMYLLTSVLLLKIPISHDCFCKTF